MNLIPVAALLVACLALSIAITALAVASRPRRRQVQNGGSHSVQVQTGGNLDLDDERLQVRAEQAARMGRHL